MELHLIAQKPIWSKEWPTEPGYYWFYGWTWCDKSFRITNNKPPKPHFVEVNKTSGQSLIYVTKGNFMYKSERHIGLWTPAFPPEAPDLSESNLGLEKEE